MKFNKETSMVRLLVYRNVFLYNDTQWCGMANRAIKGINRKRWILDDWKKLYRATGVPAEVPEWNWGRGDV